MKLGLIVLCNDEDELQEQLSKLTGAVLIEPSAGKLESVDEDDLFDEGSEDEDDLFSEEPEDEELYEPTQAEMKTTLIALKETCGESALRELFQTHGVKNFKLLPEDEWPTCYAEATALVEAHEKPTGKTKGKAAGKTTGKTSGKTTKKSSKKAPDAETVKTAVQKYATLHGRDKAEKILKVNGLNTVRGLKSASAEQLTGIMEALD